MIFPLNVSRQLVKSGSLELNYNPKNRKKYELGYWDTVQDISNSTNKPISGYYRTFRPIYKTSDYQKAVLELNSLKN